MTKIRIPDIGEKLVTTAEWTFPLYSEHRNDSLFNYLGIPGYLGIDHPVGRAYSWYDNYEGGREAWEIHRADRSKELPKLKSFPVTFPAGAVFTVDRIYIRKGVKEFSSVSLILNKKQKGPRVRFWVKLDDINNAPLELA